MFPCQRWEPSSEDLWSFLSLYHFVTLSLSHFVPPSVGNQVLKIRGPSCHFVPCDDVLFHAKDVEGGEVGKTTSKLSNPTP